MRRPSWALGIAALWLAACGSSGGGEVDTGLRVDAGFFQSPDSGYDGGSITLDSGADGALDAGFAPDAIGSDTIDTDQGGPPDSGADAGFADAVPQDLGPPPDTGPVMQSGEVVITVFQARATAFEWFQVQNNSSSAIDLTGYTVSIGSKAGLGPQPIRAASDRNDTAHTPVIVSAGQMAWGVPNTSSPNGSTANFVFGTPDIFAGHAFNGSGDSITIGSASGVSDRVDFRQAATSGSVGPSDFPLVLDLPTSLDSATSVGPNAAIANDSANAWCVQRFLAQSPGHPNLDCTKLLINELTYDWAQPGGPHQAAGHQFVEIAGAAGASLNGARLVRVASTGAVTGEVPISNGRMPLKGLYVVADGAAGNTQVANADQVLGLSLETSTAAIQLVRTATGSTPMLLDAFAHGGVPANLTDTTRGLLAVLGTPVRQVPVVAHPANYARNQDETTSRNDSLDFRYEPAPSPGAPNGAGGTFIITQITPSEAVNTASVTVVYHGTDFGDGLIPIFGTASIGGCSFIDANSLGCVVRSNAGQKPGLISPILLSPFQNDATAQMFNSFRWTGVANGGTQTSTIEVGYCNLQYPISFSVAAGATTPLIYGRVYEAGLTDVNTGAPPGLFAEVGFGPVGFDPTRSNSWQWFGATFNQKYGNNDEFQGSFTAPPSGAYWFTTRFSLDQGLDWTYCDIQGAGLNGGLLPFDAWNLGTMTVP
jgi:hypothetical protein